ncbi:MAG: DNA gyrase C-terminal beta-propeller domain-containing protein [Polyangiaceae bacterium]
MCRGGFARGLRPPSSPEGGSSHRAGRAQQRARRVRAWRYGKQTSIGEFRLQSRGGKGVILIDASDRNGLSWASR